MGNGKVAKEKRMAMRALLWKTNLNILLPQQNPASVSSEERMGWLLGRQPVMFVTGAFSQGDGDRGTGKIKMVL